PPTRPPPRTRPALQKRPPQKGKKETRRRRATAEGCSWGIAAGREQGRDVRFNGGGAGGRCGAAVVTPEETAAQRVRAVLAERDAVQANLLELDGSFAKQVLEGAALSGQTRDRWAAASAELATLWETFLAYSAVVDRVAALGSGARHPGRKDLPPLRALLPGGCAQLPGAPVPLARRDRAAAPRPPVTLAAAVAAMRRA